MLALAERLLGHLEVADVPRLARPFAARHIDDWSTCDWYCVKVLGPFVERVPDRRAAAEAVAAWRAAESLWQRRAAAVAFANLARRGDEVFDGLTDLVLEVCASNVRDPARFSQTGVGWVLRELSRASPDAVAHFVSAHRDAMSREAIRSATSKLPAAQGRNRPASRTTANAKTSTVRRAARRPTHSARPPTEDGPTTEPR